MHMHASADAVSTTPRADQFSGPAFSDELGFKTSSSTLEIGRGKHNALSSVKGTVTLGGGYRRSPVSQEADGMSAGGFWREEQDGQAASSQHSSARPICDFPRRPPRPFFIFHSPSQQRPPTASKQRIAISPSARWPSTLRNPGHPSRSVDGRRHHRKIAVQHQHAPRTLCLPFPDVISLVSRSERREERVWFGGW